jgi:hypothetical protein
MLDSQLPKAASGIRIKKGAAMTKNSEPGIGEGPIISSGDTKKSGESREGKGSGFDKKVMDFAEDLGTLLGTAEKKATEWMAQRQSIEAQLIQIRDTASELLKKLAAGGTEVAKAVERGRERVRSRAKNSKDQ